VKVLQAMSLAEPATDPDPLHRHRTPPLS